MPPPTAPSPALTSTDGEPSSLATTSGASALSFFCFFPFPDLVLPFADAPPALHELSTPPPPPVAQKPRPSQYASYDRFATATVASLYAGYVTGETSIKDLIFVMSLMDWPSSVVHFSPPSATTNENELPLRSPLEISSFKSERDSGSRHSYRRPISSTNILRVVG